MAAFQSATCDLTTRTDSSYFLFSSFGVLSTLPSRCLFAIGLKHERSLDTVLRNACKRERERKKKKKRGERERGGRPGQREETDGKAKHVLQRPASLRAKWPYKHTTRREAREPGPTPREGEGRRRGGRR